MPNKYLDSVGLTEYTGLVKTALNAKAPLSSPALTGTPTAPTPTAGDDSTKIATTEFVQDAIDSEETRADGAYLPLAGGTVTGNLSVSGSITGNVTGNASTATNATNDANGNPIASTYLPLAGGTLTGAVNGVTPTAGDESTKLATTAYVREEVRQHSGIPIGHIYFSVNPNIPQGSLPLFGGEFSRDTYADLWAWVQQQAGYCKTEAEWQALATNNNNNVPYYSDGDGSTTFRVPSMRCWVKGADGTVVEVGSYKAAGLPNITGEFTYGGTVGNLYNSNAATISGAFYPGTAKTGGRLATTAGETSYATKFSAFRSSSIYGNSSTVQPESIVGMWLVKAYGTIEDTGTIDEQAYIDDRIAALPNTFLPLAGGTMSGDIGFNGYNNRKVVFELTDDGKSLNVGWRHDERDGAFIGLRSSDFVNREGEFCIGARNASEECSLVGTTAGNLNWAGNKVCTLKRETLPITATSNNGTVTSKSATRVGNIVQVSIAIKLSSASNIGSTITVTLGGLPQSVGNVGTASFYGTSCMIGSLGSSGGSIRVLSTNLAANSEFGVNFIYVTSAQ